MYLSLNGSLISDETPVVCPNTAVLLYGYGLFETLKVQVRGLSFSKKTSDGWPMDAKR